MLYILEKEVRERSPRKNILLTQTIFYVVKRISGSQVTTNHGTQD